MSEGRTDHRPPPAQRPERSYQQPLSLELLTWHFWMVVRAGPPLPSSPSWLQFSFSDFISDSCRCSALPSGSGCLRVFCYKRVTFTQLDQSPIRHRDTTPSLRPT